MSMIQTTRTSAYVREQEYQALRQFVRLMERADDAQYAGKMRRALGEELTPRQSQLVDMYYHRQMRMQDIADELGVDISTVSRTLKRARGKLKTCLRYGGRALMGAMDN